MDPEEIYQVFGNPISDHLKKLKQLFEPFSTKRKREKCASFNQHKASLVEDV